MNDNKKLLAAIAKALGVKESKGIDKNNPSSWPEELHKIFDAYCESKMEVKTRSIPLVDYGGSTDDEC